MASLNNSDKGASSKSGGASKAILQRMTGASPAGITDRFLPDASDAVWLRSVHVIQTLSLIFLIVAVFLSSVSIVGWICNLDPLKHMLYNQLTGFPTAFWLAFVSLASAPAVTNFKDNAFTKSLKIIGRVALVVALVAGMTLWLEHILGQDWNINIAVFQPQGDVPALTLPGPTPVDVSFCLIFASITALCLDLLGTKMPLLYQALSLVMVLPSFFLVLACMFGVGDAVDVFCAYQGCVRFKYLNYTILFCLQSAIFLARPTIGMTSFLALDSMGGRQVRMFILSSLLMIPVAWVLVFAKSHEIINEPTAIVLGLIAFVLVVGIMVAYGARKMDKIDQEKQASQQSLNELNALQQTHFNYKMVCLECGQDHPDGTDFCPDDGTVLSRVLDKLAPGSVFGEKYEIVVALGSGGMSTVYKAHHLFLEKVVAIKLLNQQLAGDINAVQRFQVEAKACFDLDHPNLLGVYDFGMSRDGQAYIVMDYLEGESLTEVIHREEQLSVARALPIFLDISRGLGFAHEKGILHRDIKPSNIMLVKAPNGKELAKIVDFGLAKVYDESALKLTQTGDIFGSPLYMSPEQCRGLRLDNRSDLYSLGVLMYETLAGRAPIIGTSVYDTFAKKMSDTPPPFEPSLMVPEWLARLIFCLLRCEPKERPPNARILVEALTQNMKAAK